MSDELAEACRVLGALEAESPVAADMLRNLVALLQRYRVQGAGDAAEGRLPRQEEVASAVAAREAHREETRWGAVDQRPAAPRFVEPVPLVVGEPALAPVPDDSGFGLDGLWDDFVVDSSHDYDQLFADLDSYCGVA